MRTLLDTYDKICPDSLYRYSAKWLAPEPPVVRGFLPFAFYFFPFNPMAPPCSARFRASQGFRRAIGLVSSARPSLRLSSGPGIPLPHRPRPSLEIYRLAPVILHVFPFLSGGGDSNSPRRYFFCTLLFTLFSYLLR